ncbi:MAG: hypothetical protein UX27_C0023G0003 [Candidatus Azambacteria bacterium GW2011_GWA2_45_90]|uniref:DUF5667 domain-containing protein n=1 Tax=Candidatus Azambacteria bacterium GW2011_GWA2_45_90 TaxID=1618614 RepID=A0A0G1RAT7_9BACT|nr:MAG: hypothetical protein UX27_C0023G0003 [Candidatus Azambacteria bacterium GW2011_GWA2_45_90]
MKKLTTLSILFISLAFVAPMQASAATNAGVKPGSFFYFFDTTFENIGLFFTFSPEKKAQKALGYSDERLAEIEAVAEEKNPGAVKTAIANYESSIALATEKSKEVKDKGQAETLLNSIADNTSRNQEVLSAILIKVPEEAKAAITQAIEASKKSQEEATKQIAELKKEVSELKQELENLKGELKDKEKEPKVSGDKKDEQTKAIDKLKNEIESLKKKVSEPKQQETKVEEKKEQSKNSIVNLPSGAVVEMDTNGNIIRTIKEAPQQTYTAPAPTTQSQTSTTVQILSVNITPTITSAKVEWQTDRPTESKIFLSGGGLSSKILNSESGLSTRHSTSIENLNGDTAYSYEIEAVGNGGIYAKKSGSFSTALPVASKIFARPRYSSSNTPLEVAGANCEPADYWVSIYDQDGKEMDGVGVTISAPFMTATEKTRQEDYTRAKIHAFFRYNTPATTTTETIIFTSSNLSTSATLRVGNRLAEYITGHPLIQSGNYWYESSGGSRVDPVKVMCL